MDPITWMVLYLWFSPDPFPIALAKVILLSSVLLYPFLYLGVKLWEKTKASPLIMAILYSLLLLPFSNLTIFIQGFAFALLSYLLLPLGKAAKRYFDKKSVPLPLTLFFISICASIIGWVITCAMLGLYY